MTRTTGRTTGIDLYWLPLGAGGHSVRWNGRIFEGVRALIERRSALALYHSALIVTIPPDEYVVEMTPAWGGPDVDRGVALEGPVGLRAAGFSSFFRYEVHCWKNGSIADLEYAADSPRRLAKDTETCRRVLEVAATVPALVWGRDELRTGEMWNSNSVISWVLMRCGIDAASIAPPIGGAAPGWNAGVVAAENGTMSRP